MAGVKNSSRGFGAGNPRGWHESQRYEEEEKTCSLDRAEKFEVRDPFGK